MFDGKGLVPVYVMEDIAKAIRSKMKEQNLYKPTEMAAAIRSMTPYFYDTTGTFYILSPDYWTIHVTQSEHQTISYSASGEAVQKGVDKWGSRLFINARIVANTGYTPGTVHKTIDSTNHDIVLMAEPATAIDDMVKDGVLLTYMRSNSGTLYTKMYWKKDETTNEKVLTFENPVDLSSVDIPIRIVGSNSPDWTTPITEGLAITAMGKIKGFDSNYVLTWKPKSSQPAFNGSTATGNGYLALEYFKMPNLTHLENKGDVLRDVTTLKSVNFENLEYVNTELYASEGRTLGFLNGCTSLTDINFTQLKRAYCSFLTNCAAERMGFPNLEIVYGLSGFPNLVDISLPALVEEIGSLLCDCPKLTTVKLPSLEKARGKFLDNVPLIEEIECLKLNEMNNNFLTVNRANLRTINLPELVTANGALICKQQSLNFTNLSLPKLQSASGDAICDDSTLQVVDLPKLQTTKKGLLNSCAALTNISLPELLSAGTGLLNSCDIIASISLPKLQTISGDAFGSDAALKDINAPELQSVGGKILDTDNGIVNIPASSFPKLQSIGGSCGNLCKNLKTATFPELKTVGGDFFGFEFGLWDEHKCSLESLDAPKLEQTGNCLVFRWTDTSLGPVNLPLLKTVNGSLLADLTGNRDVKVDSVDIPSLETVSGAFLTVATNNKVLNFPNLKSVGAAFISRVAQPNIEEINVPNLESVGGICVCNQLSPSLKKLSFPKLKTVDGDFAERNTYLEEIEIPLLESANNSVCCHEPHMKKFIAPSLKTVKGLLLNDMSGLLYVDLGALVNVGHELLTDAPSLKTLIIRSNVVPTVSVALCNTKPSDCILYVPDDMISKYLADSKWSAAFDKDHIKPISEAPQPPV